MELGEGVSELNVESWKKEGKCLVCGIDHPSKKGEEPRATEWKRKQISGVGGLYAQQKRELYPSNQAPPSTYRSQGHHCIPLTCFVHEGKGDRILPLNHLLKSRADYDPNDENNRIDLPNRREDLLEAVRQGKPLQVHSGKHVGPYFSGCFSRLLDVYMALCQLCQDAESLEELIQDLKLMIAETEDEAFADVASKRNVLNPGPCHEAEEWVRQQSGISTITYPNIRFPDRS
jgi:hypothetical protein